MTRQIDKNTVIIEHENVSYYLDIPEGHNLAVIEKVFMRGFKEGINAKM